MTKKEVNYWVLFQGRYAGRVRMCFHLQLKAKALAERNGTSLATYIDGLIRDQVEADFERMMAPRVKARIRSTKRKIG